MAIFTSFFSYKGGAGRSTTCLNTIPFLAKELEAHAKSPILLLDMDIESAGMTYLLNKHEHFHKAGFDVKSFLKDEINWTTSQVSNLSDHILYKKFVPVGKLLGLEDDYAVMFLGVNDDARVKLGKAETSLKIAGVMSKFNQFAANNNIRAIVMDSAAGDQVSAEHSIKNSEKVVFCMRPTHQFRIGTFNYLSYFSQNNKSADEKEFILLPTVVPNDVKINGVSQLQRTVDDINDRVNAKELRPLDINTHFINKDALGINEITRFKWREDVLFKLEAENKLENDDEIEGLKRYQALAKAIAR